MSNKAIVQKDHWVESEEVIYYYAIGQSLPGIIAVNTSVFIGFRTAGVKGAISSALGIISPSIILITLIATLLTGFQDIPAVRHALNGIQISVCMLMAATIVQLWKSSIKSVTGIIICIIAFILAYFAGVHLILLIILSAVSGIVIKAISEKRKAKADTQQ
jgi:chromate transporter